MVQTGISVAGTDARVEAMIGCQEKKKAMIGCQEIKVVPGPRHPSPAYVRLSELI